MEYRTGKKLLNLLLPGSVKTEPESFSLEFADSDELLNDNGELTIAKASTTGYTQLDMAQILDGHDAWGPFALVKGRLLLRDYKTMVCLDIRKNKS